MPKEFVTSDQLNVIAMIEQNLGITFKGTTKSSAYYFIQKYMNASKHAYKESFEKDDLGKSKGKC